MCAVCGALVGAQLSDGQRRGCVCGALARGRLGGGQEGEGKRVNISATPKKAGGSESSSETEGSSWLPKLLPALVLAVAIWWRFYQQ